MTDIEKALEKLANEWKECGSIGGYKNVVNRPIYDMLRGFCKADAEFAGLLAKIREDLAKEYALKADPDVQGITFNLGDLSERVQKIDEQLSHIKEKDADMEKALREKLRTALSQIFANIEWKPWKDETASA